MRPIRALALALRSSRIHGMRSGPVLVPPSSRPPQAASARPGQWDRVLEPELGSRGRGGRGRGDPGPRRQRVRRLRRACPPRLPPPPHPAPPPPPPPPP